MGEPVLRKRLGDGRRVEVQIQEYTIGRFRCLAYVDGKWIDGPAEPQLLPLAIGGNTHYLGGRGGGPLIGLSTPEAEQINAALCKRQEIIRAGATGKAGKFGSHHTAQEQNSGIQ